MRLFVWGLMAFGLTACVASTSEDVSDINSFASGFERLLLQSPQQNNFQPVTFTDGQPAQQFTIRPGECWRDSRDCETGRERVEIYSVDSNIRPPEEVWYKWSVYIPEGTWIPPEDGPWVTLGQVHQRDDSGPEVQFYYRAPGFRFELSNPYSPTAEGVALGVNLLDPRQMQGRWTDVMMQARWSRAEDGFINVWINGTQRIAYEGATTNSNAPLYFKYGLYRAFTERCGGPCPEQTVLYRDVARGPTRESLN